MAGDEWREPTVTDQDRLPWLETAEDSEDNASITRIIGAVLVGLAAIAAILGGIYWFQHRKPATGNGDLIAAQEGDYKVKPDDPGGMKVDGEGDAAVATSGGSKAGEGKISVGDLPETPVEGQKANAGNGKAGAGASTATATASGPAGKLTAPAPGKPVTIASGGGAGAVVQLGAFPTEGAANAAWSAKAKRFDYLASLGKSVQKADVNGRTFYRLRVNAGSAGAAQDLCGKLKVAGETCLVTN
jgi:hypothetical protein